MKENNQKELAISQIERGEGKENKHLSKMKKIKNSAKNAYF